MTMRRRKVHAVRVCFLVGTLLAPSLSAQEKTLAERLFWRGREAMKAGDYETACRALEQSVDLRPTPGALLNLALSEEQLGRNAKALEHFQRVVELVETDDPRHGLALDKVLDLRSSEEPTIAPPPPAPVEIEKLKAPAAVVETSGAAPAAAIERAVAPQPPPKADSDLAGWGFALAGAGVAALGVSAVTGLAAMGWKNDALAHCQGKLCDEQGLASANTARWYGAVSTGTLIGGLVGVGVGSYFIVHRSRRSSTTVGVTVSAAPGLSQLLVSGSL